MFCCGLSQIYGLISPMSSPTPICPAESTRPVTEPGALSVSGKYPWSYAIFAAVVWTGLFGAALFWNINAQRRVTLEIARNQARSIFDRDLLYRQWAVDVGGVYVAVSERTPPNPYLISPRRDVTTTDGQRLTLINPAYMTRHVHEMSADAQGIQGHLTSLQPLRPENAPDEWEELALRALVAGDAESSAITNFRGAPHLRLMRPLVTEAKCLNCHHESGIAVGDLRGGIAISVPMKPFWALERDANVSVIAWYSSLWGIGLVIIGLIGERVRRNSENAALQKARMLESEQRYLDTLHSSSDAVLLLDEERFVECNEATVRLLGYGSREDILQCHPSALSPATQPDGRDSREKASELIAAAFDRGSMRFEWMHRRADGADFPAEVTLTPVTYHGRSMLHCVWRDLTEERQLRAERARVRKTMEIILRSLPVGVVVIDRNKIVRHVNAAALAMMGYDSDSEIINRIRHETLCPAEDCTCPILDLGQQVDNAERTLIDRWGHKVPILKTVVPITLDDDEVLLETFVDISQRKQMEEDLRHAKENAEHANRAKSDFLARMSHELRTPLTGILGFADLLLGSEFTESTRREYLETIRSSGRHLLELINDVLDLSKIEAGRIEVEHVGCAPHDVLSEVVSIMRACAKSKNIDVQYSWSTKVPVSITSDAGKLRQILLNLTGNAVKFTHKGLVTIQASVQQEAGHHELVVEIADTGIGIPAEKLEAVFEPFRQADSGITREFGGTGLGLSISRQLARALGGDITVASVVGEGSRFTLKIDVGDLTNVVWQDPPAADAAPAGPNPLPRLGDVRFSREHVLLVEDGHINSRFISAVLSKAGLRVSTVENGALGVAFALEHPCDLILMDMQMPVMDGYAAARKLRETGFAKPIIALTAHAMDGDVQKCLDAGCSAYVSKPIDIPTLLTAIIDALQSEAEPDAVRRPQVVTDTSPLVSSLPVDDDIFREIVSEFTAFVGDVISQMRDAASRDEIERLARLAHDLRGCAGTAGFPGFTDPARDLEGLAVTRSRAQFAAAIDVLDNLAHRIVLPGATEELPHN